MGRGMLGGFSISQVATVGLVLAQSVTPAKLPFLVPVQDPEAILTVGFGMKRHPLMKTLRFHGGVDWAAHAGASIVAVEDGTVIDAGYRGEFGNRVHLGHAAGVETSYAHLSRLADGLKPGDEVSRGQVIGYVGTTGLAEGPKLHFDLRVDGALLDPLDPANWQRLRRPTPL